MQCKKINREILPGDFLRAAEPSLLALLVCERPLVSERTPCVHAPGHVGGSRSEASPSLVGRNVLCVRGLF